MALRPGHTIRQVRRPWTRTARKVVTAAFVVGVPDSRVRMFSMGNRAFAASAELVLHLKSSQDVQLRDNALESARVTANKVFEKSMPEEYFFQVRVYPHQCLREHAILMGAHADRLSDGMRLAFGRPSGRAVIVKAGQILMSVHTLKKHETAARRGFHLASKKLPGKCVIT